MLNFDIRIVLQPAIDFSLELSIIRLHNVVGLYLRKHLHLHLEFLSLFNALVKA